MSDSNQFSSISEDLTEEQAEWKRKKMPYDPFENTSFNNKNRINNGNSYPQNSESTKSEKRERKKVMSYKYSQKMKGPLYEAVLLEGKPAFVTFKNKMLIIPLIVEETRTIRAPNEEEYPYAPYAFANLDELNQYVIKAKNQTIDSLFEKTLSFVRKYNDQDNYKIVLLAIDIIWSYFQDKFSTAHYLGVIGDNGSGKSTFGDTFEAVGYRAVNMTDPNAANLFRILDRIEPGQCTFVIDEADKIDQSDQIMNILKTGYQIKGKVPRTNLNTNEQEFYYTYCFKMYIAEKSPDLMKAKGIHDRSFVITTYIGNPTNDIKEIQNPSGIVERQHHLDELNELRKLELVYRLIHFNEPMQEIYIDIQGRDKELCKPFLQLYYGSKSYEQVHKTLLHFLEERKSRKRSSFEASLYPLIANLVSEKGNEVFVSDMWYIIKTSITGKEDEKRPDVYHTDDYGTVYRNKISRIICDRFAAGIKHKNNGNVLIFNKENLAKVGKQYSFNIGIKKTIPEFNQKSESSEGSENSKEIIEISKTGNSQANQKNGGKDEGK